MLLRSGLKWIVEKYFVKTEMEMKMEMVRITFT